MATTTLLKLNSPKTKSTAKHSKSAESRRSDSYEIELLEYEWPDLPPLNQVRDAITRNKISSGISYLLPLNPVSSGFTPDLRAMLVQPNRSYDNLLFDCSKSGSTAKVRFFSNSIDTKWTDNYIRNVPLKINAESEQVRNLYGRSAPNLNSAKRRMGLDARKSRQRSSLHVQIKTNEPPEATKMREEVERVIASLKEDDEELDQDNDNPGTDLLESDLSKAMKNASFKRKESIFKESKHANALAEKMETLRLEQKKFHTYQKLKNYDPPKLVIPNVLRSSYLSEESNQHIWEWLHYGEHMTDFDFFLSVCG